MSGEPGRRWPWGYGRAPALCCDECGHAIGAGRTHFITAGNVLLCGGCMVPTFGTQSLHARHYPACAEDWHDMYDHPLKLATRAAAWMLLTDAERKRSD